MEEAQRGGDVTGEIDISVLPIPFPEVQLGTPVLEETVADLPEESLSALVQLFELARPIFNEDQKLDEPTYAALEEAYRKVQELEVGYFCFVIQIGAAFLLEETAILAALAASGAGPCSACHEH